MQAIDFLSACVSKGFSFFTGVPCSFLQPLINSVIVNNNAKYIIASSEGEAVGIASGYYLSGSKSIVMCQNSGLGNAINPLTSLNFPFRIPLLLIVTLRGEQGLNDEPQHELMGKVTGTLLDTICIPWRFFPDKLELVDSVLDEAQEKIEKSNISFALLMRKGCIEEAELPPLHPIGQGVGTSSIEGRFSCHPSIRMSRLNVIKIIRESLPKEYAIISTTGKISRELYTVGDSINQFYMVGSMGCASSLGFGILCGKPQKSVVVLDGDGAVLMKMGTLATIGHYKPERFIHIILDNESYESTGGQRTVSQTVDFSTVAFACGYRKCYRVDTYKDLEITLSKALETPGPILIHVKVSGVSSQKLGRPTIKPSQVKERFMKFLEEN